VRIFRFLNFGREQDLDSILYWSDKFMRVAWYRSLQRQHFATSCKLSDSYSYQNLAGCGNTTTLYRVV
jgi:hypothetical protein